MTLAVCIKCGGKKVGALTRCLGCRFCPENAGDKARSMLLSDHFLSKEQLETASQTLIRGEAIAFDDAAVQELSMASQLVRPNPKVLGVRITSWIALGIAVLIGLVCGSCSVATFQWLGI